MIPPIRVFLIHEYRILMEALTASLKRCERVQLVASSGDLDAATEALHRIPVDVVLVDGNIDHERARAFVRNITDSLPEIKIIPLGLDHSIEIVGFIEAGASGYLAREASFEELIEMIESVHREEVPCSPRVAAAVLSRLVELSRRCRRRPRRQLPEGAQVTPREEEVLRLVAAGLRNKEIARRLDITLPTVKNHVHKILEKFQVRGRREAIRLAYESGLLDDPIPWSPLDRRR